MLKGDKLRGKEFDPLHFSRGLKSTQIVGLDAPFGCTQGRLLKRVPFPFAVPLCATLNSA